MLSVIIPCYNVEKYLEDAVASVIRSGLSDMEIILVDDGSTDSTPDICRRLAQTHPSTIRLISQPNAGPSAARNAALAIARGEWIFFADSDDLIVSHNLPLLLDLAISQDADITQGDFIRFSDKTPPYNSYYSYKSYNSYNSHKPRNPLILSGREAAERSLYQHIEKGGGPDFGINNSPCGKIYRRSLFDEVEFPEGKIYEDLGIFYLLALRASKVILTPLPIYLYRQNPDSITHTFSRRRLDVLEITEGIEHYIAAHHPDLLPAARDRRFAANFNMYRLLNKYQKSHSSHHSQNSHYSHSSHNSHYSHNSDNSNNSDFYSKYIAITYKYIRSHARSILLNPRSRRKNRLGALLALILPPSLLRHL